MLLREIAWAVIVAGSLAGILSVIFCVLRAMYREWKDDHDRRVRKISVLKG